MVMTPVDLDSLSKAELKERHLDLLERFCALEEQMMALKDELARLKGGSGRPPIKPSGMERSSEGKQAKAEGRTGKSGRGPRKAPSSWRRAGLPDRRRSGMRWP